MSDPDDKTFCPIRTYQYAIPGMVVSYFSSTNPAWFFRREGDVGVKNFSVQTNVMFLEHHNNLLILVWRVLLYTVTSRL